MFVRGGISYYFPRLPWAFAKANCFFYLCWIDKQLISRFFFFLLGTFAIILALYGRGFYTNNHHRGY